MAAFFNTLEESIQVLANRDTSAQAKGQALLATSKLLFASFTLNDNDAPSYLERISTILLNEPAIDLTVVDANEETIFSTLLNHEKLAPLLAIYLNKYPLAEREALILSDLPHNPNPANNFHALFYAARHNLAALTVLCNHVPSHSARIVIFKTWIGQQNTAALKIALDANWFSREYITGLLSLNEVFTHDGTKSIIIIKLFMQYGEKLTNMEKERLLYRASVHFNPPILEFLLQQNIFTQEQIGRTLNIAINTAIKVALPTLLASQLPLDILNQALCASIAVNNSYALGLLLDYGADIDYSPNTHFTMTPIMQASWQGALDCLQLLINRGASITRLNNHGIDALGFAKLCHRDNCVALLENVLALQELPQPITPRRRFN